MVVNDVHLGVQRVGGATPVTAKALRDWLAQRLDDLLMQHLDKDVVINGDLFDMFEVLLSDVLMFYMTACKWIEASAELQRGASPGARPILVLGLGNHDIAKDSSKLSSFALVAKLLAQRYPDRVKVVTEPQEIFPGHYMVPHVVNQEIFNLAIQKTIDEVPPSFVYVHANFDNGYAVEADHSLNMSVDQALALVGKGHTLIFGHEHQSREPIAGVVITGNQWPSSIADCLNNAGDAKNAIVINAKGEIEPVITWEAQGSFAQVDWREVEGFDPTGLQFIRLVGHATAEEAAKALERAAQLRKRAPAAFVVARGFKVEGLQDMNEMKETAEEMKVANVLDYLYENLDPPQVEAVKKLLVEHGGVK